VARPEALCAWRGWLAARPSWSFVGSAVAACFHALRPHTLRVIGLRALGGPVALQAKRAGIPHVVGWSPEPGERAAAARQGALDDAPPRAVDVARAADLLMLAAPPAANLRLLDELHDHMNT